MPGVEEAVDTVCDLLHIEPAKLRRAPALVVPWRRQLDPKRADVALPLAVARAAYQRAVDFVAAKNLAYNLSSNWLPFLRVTPVDGPDAPTVEWSADNLRKLQLSKGLLAPLVVDALSNHGWALMPKGLIFAGPGARKLFWSYNAAARSC